MKDTPAGWSRISSCVVYPDPHKAIDWLCKAFGFELRLKVEGEAGAIVHSELVIGNGVIMVAGEGGTSHHPDAPHHKSPASLGGANTQNVMIYIDDVDAHCARAREMGAKIHKEPKTTDYGEEYWTDRGYEAEDIGGHHWWFCQRMK